ncbi:Repetin [Streptomyces sp. NPDC004435]|uniref:Repetin n=1 Tax=Streptomyces sp. NPDC004435 TaxID=3364701 RepID=UPI00367438CA
MNRRTKIVAVAAALLVTAGAAGSATASAGASGSPAATLATAGEGRGGVPREAAALTGSAWLDRDPATRQKVRFAFDAHLARADRNDPLAATGTFRYEHSVGDETFTAVVEVDCLATGGPVATVTGIVRETNVPGLDGKRVGVSVLDDGKRDRLGYSWLASTPQTDDVPPCNAAAPHEKVVRGGGDFRVLPWVYDGMAD